MQLIYHTTPRDEAIANEENASGIDEAREARRKCIEMINAFAAEIDSVLSSPGATMGQVATAFYGPAFAMGLLAIGGISMTEAAERFGITRAAISKKAVVWCRAHGLPASMSMKKDETRAKYRKAREDVVRENSTNNDRDV